MSDWKIIVCSVSLAFAIVNVAYPYLSRKKFFRRKPFNCIMCMSGWCSFGLSLLHGYFYGSILFLAAGLFAGAMFEAIQMRWL